MDKTNVLDETVVPPFPILVNSVSPLPRATIEYWHLRQAASKVWCGRNDIIEATLEVADDGLRHEMQEIIEKAAQLAARLEEKARLVNDESLQGRCTCNGTESSACSYCREHHAHDEIPF